MSYEISTSYYEGPMDLLLDLVSKKKIEITEISVSDLADRYIETLQGMQALDMDITSDFIYMASRLLEIKSRYMLYLSSEEESEDPRLELFDAILEYSIYRNVSEFFAIRHQSAPNRYFRLSPEIYVEEVIDLTRIKLGDLVDAFPAIIKKEVAVESKTFLKRIIPVEEKIEHIHQILRQKNKFYFDEALRKPEPEEKVATMLGMLEMAKGKVVNINQDLHLEPILIERGIIDG